MIIKGRRYRFNIKKLLGNIGKLTTFILLELSFAYMFTQMAISIIEKYNWKEVKKWLQLIQKKKWGFVTLAQKY